MDFLDYELPPDRIAQRPCEPRDAARLLVVRRATGQLEHHTFRDLPDLLASGDLLVRNDTKVLAARLLGRREWTGGKWEGLFLRQSPDGLWELMAQAGGAVRPGEWVAINPGPLRLELVSRTPEGHWLARPDRLGDPATLLAAHGRMPLPPYIRRGRADASDVDRYQTVFAAHPGAVAAPTAGLHFTPTVFDRLRLYGISWANVTLHVGPGTFQPIRADDYRDHVMHSEWGELPEATVEAISNCRTGGGKVVAVGTTTVRVLETVAASGPLRPWSGETTIYIHPPFPFRAVDALITNFHLPRSTLLLLVAAFAGVDLIREAYRVAVAENYRFYSYGDAMMIV